MNDMTEALRQRPAYLRTRLQAEQRMTITPDKPSVLDLSACLITAAHLRTVTLPQSG